MVGNGTGSAQTGRRQQQEGNGAAGRALTCGTPRARGTPPMKKEAVWKLMATTRLGSRLPIRRTVM